MNHILDAKVSTDYLKIVIYFLIRYLTRFYFNTSDQSMHFHSKEFVAYLTSVHCTGQPDIFKTLNFGVSVKWLTVISPSFSFSVHPSGIRYTVFSVIFHTTLSYLELSTNRTRIRSGTRSSCNLSAVRICERYLQNLQIRIWFVSLGQNVEVRILCLLRTLVPPPCEHKTILQSGSLETISQKSLIYG